MRLRLGCSTANGYGHLQIKGGQRFHKLNITSSGAYMLGNFVQTIHCISPTLRSSNLVKWDEMLNILRRFELTKAILPIIL